MARNEKDGDEEGQEKEGKVINEKEFHLEMSQTLCCRTLHIKAKLSYIVVCIARAMCSAVDKRF